MRRNGKNRHVPQRYPRGEAAWIQQKDTVDYYRKIVDKAGIR